MCIDSLTFRQMLVVADAVGLFALISQGTNPIPIQVIEEVKTLPLNSTQRNRTQHKPTQRNAPLLDASTAIFQTFLSVLPYAFNWAAFYKASFTLSDVEKFMFATYFAFLVVYLLIFFALASNIFDTLQRIGLLLRRDDALSF